MKLFPFGDIEQEKYDICMKYGLLEQVADTEIWRLTNKCKNNYEPISFIQWLEGKADRPKRGNRKNTINELLRL